MDLLEAMRQRHAVRAYTEKKIDSDLAARLESEIESLNTLTGLSFQVRFDDSQAFENIMARYGAFSKVNNYIALVGKKTDKAARLCGYYGEKLVLLLQQLGLNTCWVGGSYRKRKVKVKVGLSEKLYLVIAFGYGDEEGRSHRIKGLEEVCEVENEEMPAWFLEAMNAVQLAPSAMNQQRYLFTLRGNTVLAHAHKGLYTQIDLGIAQYHFEVGAAAAGATQDDWHWAEGCEIS